MTRAAWVARAARATAGIAWVTLAAAGAGCSSRSSSPAPASTTVHTLRLPDDTATLPDQPGRDRVEARCMTCHTSRYVLEQPPLPRRTWQAEVEKMQKMYGAPVPDGDVPALVDYLVAVRGTGD